MYCEFLMCYACIYKYKYVITFMFLYRRNHTSKITDSKGCYKCSIGKRRERGGRKGNTCS